MVALAGVSIASAALTFNGTGITGDSGVMVDGSGIVTIGTSSSTGITVGMLGITATFPGTVTITGSTTTLQNLVVSGTCTGCGVGNFTAGGDLSGSSTSQTVIGLQGKPVSTTTPLTNQVLTWNGTFWTPTNVSSTGGISSINGLSNATTSIVGAGTVTVSTSSPNTITITGTGSGAIAINSLATSTFQIQGTANQITVATSSPNIISLSLPQNIGTTSIPTFGGLFLNGNATTTGNLVVLGSLLDAGGNPYVTSTSVGASSSTNSLNYLAPASSSVSRTLTSKLGDIVSVKDFGAVGDGVTDDYAALVAAGTAAHAIGGCVYFPAAVYAFGTPISITGNDDNTCWISNNATLKYIGVATSSAFTFNGSISSNGTRIYISNLTLNGGLATDGIVLQHATGFELSRVGVTNVSGAGIHCENCTTGLIDDPMVSSNIAPFVTTPTNGVLLDNSANTTILLPKIEGVSGAGISCTNGVGSQGLNVEDGTSEGNGIGLNIACPYSTVSGVDLEANSTADLVCDSGCSYSTFSGVLSASVVGLNAIGTATGNTFTGGSYSTISFGSNTMLNSLYGVVYHNSYTDGGMGNKHYGLAGIASDTTISDSFPLTEYVSPYGNSDTICANASDTNCTFNSSGYTIFSTSYVISTSTLTTGKTLAATACFTFSTPSTAAAMTLRVQLGSTAVWVNNGGAPAANQNGDKFCYRWSFEGTSGAGASESVYTSGDGDTPLGMSSASMSNVVSEPKSIPTSIGLPISIMVTFSGTKNAGNYITLNQLVVQEF